MLLVLLGSDRPNQPNFINYATKKGVTMEEKQNRKEKKNG